MTGGKSGSPAQVHVSCGIKALGLPREGLQRLSCPEHRWRSIEAGERGRRRYSLLLGERQKTVLDLHHQKSRLREISLSRPALQKPLLRGLLQAKRKMISGESLNQGSANILHKGSGNSKYFRLCRPYKFCYRYSALPLQHKSSHRQHVNEWVWQHCNKTLFTKMCGNP